MAGPTYRPTILWQEYQSVTEPIKSPWDAVKTYPLPQPITSWEVVLLSNLKVHNIPHSDISVIVGGSREKYEISIEGWIYPVTGVTGLNAERLSILKQLATLKKALRGNPEPQRGLPGFFTLQRWKKSGGVEEVYKWCKTKRLRYLETSTPLYRMEWSALIIGADGSK